MKEPVDLFIRRVYHHKGINIVVDIDLINKQITLAEKRENKYFEPKKWLFAERSLDYLQGWQNILDAMKYAISEASKVLEEANQRDQEEFAIMFRSLNDALKPKRG